MSDPSDNTPGQKFLASLVDIAFFVVLCIMGWRGVLKEGAVLMLLGLYAQGRFNVAMQKQQTVQMATLTGAPPGGSPPSLRPPGGGSGRYAVTEAVPVTPERPEGTMPAAVPRPGQPRVTRRILSIVEAYLRRPAFVVFALMGLLLVFFGGKLP